MSATLWQFSGLFFGGDVDLAGVEIGDICTGWFATTSADRAAAEELLLKRYSDLAGRFSIKELKVANATPWAAKTLKRVIKTGGTKQVPVLA